MFVCSNWLDSLLGSEQVRLVSTTWRRGGDEQQGTSLILMLSKGVVTQAYLWQHDAPVSCVLGNATLCHSNT